ncbi:DUF2142 domain-containing protein [Clostridium algidicarnis]|uniref:DUF2142 domain-containing protein n=1 Tax=Clostridium algidicarnis TaxID=37659 RepID=UPI001629AFAB|nr:DUF2142 domain-containing protein [Clostridium algidicarnis]MBB6698566.1 DUF2142 domain-containing protein [Clostridium algidicarnis]
MKKKRFEINKRGKSFSSIAVNTYSDQVDFKFEATDNQYPLDVSFEKIYADNRLYLNFMRAGLIAISLMVITYLILYKEIAFKKLNITFILICILFGSYIAIANPFKYSWDESEHFVKAYYLSYGIFDVIKKPPVSLPENFNYLLENPIPQTFREKVAYTKQFSESDYPIKEYVNSTAKNYTSIPYLPAALGIWISRTLSLPFIYTLYFGRIFGLIGYIALCALAIKNAKIGKRLIFIIALMPTSLFLASSYSADSLTIAYSLVCTVQFINILCAPNKSVDLKQIVLLTASIILIIACKPTYAPFALFLLAIPHNKFKDKKQSYRYKISAFVLCVLVFVFLMIYSQRFHEIFWPVPGLNPDEQIRYVLRNLPIYFISFIKSIFENLLGNIMGSTVALAYSGEIKGIYFMVIFVLMIAMILIDYEEECSYLKLPQKLALFFTAFCSWGLVYTALYVSFTPLGAIRADGVQARYIKPILFPMLLLFKNKNIKLEPKIKEVTLNKIVVISMIIVTLATGNHFLIRYCL